MPLPTAKFKFEYPANEKKQGGAASNVASAHDDVRRVLENVRAEDIQRELAVRANIQVEVREKKVHEKPPALDITFNFSDKVRHRKGNIVEIYKVLQQVEKRTDEFLYYLIRGARDGDPNWFDGSGVKRSHKIVETAGFINRDERVVNSWTGFWWGLGVGGLVIAYALNFQTVNGWVLTMIGKGG